MMDLQLLKQVWFFYSIHLHYVKHFKTSAHLDALSVPPILSSKHLTFEQFPFGKI